MPLVLRLPRPVQSGALARMQVFSGVTRSRHTENKGKVNKTTPQTITAILEQIEYDLGKHHDILLIYPIFYLLQDAYEPKAGCRSSLCSGDRIAEEEDQGRGWRRPEAELRQGLRQAPRRKQRRVIPGLCRAIGEKKHQ